MNGTSTGSKASRRIAPAGLRSSGRREFLEVLASVGALAATSVACKRRGPGVTVYTSVDQVFAAPIFRAFETKSGIAVRAVFDTEETKSTGVLNRLLGEAEHPQADVFWSGDPVRPFSLLKRGLVAPYLSPSASAIPASFRAADGAWTGTAARARVLLFNETRVPKGDAPRSVRDLANPRWRGQCAMANPLFGTTTMHAGAWFAAWGAQKTVQFFDELKANGVRIASSNGEVKRLVAAGEVAFGLTDTDDAHEALAAKAPVAVVYPDQDALGTLVMPTSVLLMRGAPNPDAGRRLVDHLLSLEVEQQLASSAAHMPLRPGVPVPAGVRSVSDLRAMNVDYATVASEMESQQAFLRRWVGL